MRAIPTLQEEADKQQVADRALEMVRREAESSGYILSVEMGGSFAKGTWVASDADVDVFVLFEKDTPADVFAEISRQVGFAALQPYGPYERYADHPYVEADMEGTKINVVPCYMVERGKWKSAADRSPYHTRYMKENLTKHLRDEVRRFKVHLKEWGVYGAQMSSQGFSGYAAEVLVLHFGGCQEAIAALAASGRGDVIGKCAGTYDTPLVIMDPIDDRRNLATAISGRNIGTCIMACRAAQQETGRENRHDRFWNRVVVAGFAYRPRNAEVIWGQVRKCIQALIRQMGREGFAVAKDHITISDGRVCMFFLLESLSISSALIRKGPDVFCRPEAEEFMQKNAHRLLWVSGESRLMCMTERVAHATVVLRRLLDNPQKTGIPSGLYADLEGGYTVREGAELTADEKAGAHHLVSTQAILDRRPCA